MNEIDCPLRAVKYKCLATQKTGVPRGNRTIARLVRDERAILGDSESPKRGFDRWAYLWGPGSSVGSRQLG